MVAHAVFPLETLLTNWAGVGLFIGVRKSVTVQMVHIPEGLSTCFTGMVFPYLGRVWVCVQVGVGWVLNGK